VGKSTAKWIIGQRGRWGWALYWTSRTSLRKMRFWPLAEGPLWSPENCKRRWDTVARKPNVEEVLRQNGGLGPAHGEASKHFPQVASWLCDSTYEDGSPKGRTVLSAERKGDRIRLCLRSADSGLMVEHFAENLADAVLGLELLLASNDTPWQLDPYPMDKPKGKVRKKT
jgi:hypothetical protein